MAVITPPAVDTSAPELGTEYWDPAAIEGVVFTPPSRRGALAYDADLVDLNWERLAAEVRMLHDILQEKETAISELQTGVAGEIKSSAIAEAAVIKRGALHQAGVIVGEARMKAEQLEADALDRIGRADRAVTPEPQLVHLPPLDLEDLRGSMKSRVEYVNDLRARVFADAHELLAVGAFGATALTEGTTSAAPVEPEPVEVHEQHEPMTTLTNETDAPITAAGGDESFIVDPGESLTVPTSEVTDTIRGVFKKHTWHRPGPDDTAVRVMKSYPLESLFEGQVIALDGMPPGVLFETIGDRSPLPAWQPPELATGELPAVPYDAELERRAATAQDEYHGDAARSDMFAEVIAAHDEHDGDQDWDRRDAEDADDHAEDATFRDAPEVGD